MGRYVHGGHVDRLERNLFYALSEDVGFQGILREKEGKFSGRNPNVLVVKGPDCRHVIPLRDDIVCFMGNFSVKRWVCASPTTKLFFRSCQT